MTDRKTYSGSAAPLNGLRIIESPHIKPGTMLIVDDVRGFPYGQFFVMVNDQLFKVDNPAPPRLPWWHRALLYVSHWHRWAA